MAHQHSNESASAICIHRKLPTLLLVGLMVTAAGGKSGPTRPPAPGTGDTGHPTISAEPCAVGEADAQLTIPIHDLFPEESQKSLLSRDDKYWYDRYHGVHQGCDRFVVEFLINIDSNKKEHPGGFTTWGDIGLHGYPFNLPSAISPPVGGHAGGPEGATTPTTRFDCNNLRVDVRFYEKLHTENGFKVLKDTVHKGRWVGSDQDGQCLIEDPFRWGFTTSGKDRTQEYDTYRVAAKVVLRALPQEVRIAAESLKPPIP